MNGLARIGADNLTEQLDLLAMKIEVITIALSSCSRGLHEILDKPDVPAAPLMLTFKKQPTNVRCSVCKKYCKKGETIHEKCKEKT